MGFQYWKSFTVFFSLCLHCCQIVLWCFLYRWMYQVFQLSLFVLRFVPKSNHIYSALCIYFLVCCLVYETMEEQEHSYNSLVATECRPFTSGSIKMENYFLCSYLNRQVSFIYLCTMSKTALFSSRVQQSLPNNNVPMVHLAISAIETIMASLNYDSGAFKEVMEWVLHWGTTLAAWIVNNMIVINVAN